MMDESFVGNIAISKNLHFRLHTTVWVRNHLCFRHRVSHIEYIVRAYSSCNRSDENRKAMSAEGSFREGRCPQRPYIVNADLLQGAALVAVRNPCM